MLLSILLQGQHSKYYINARKKNSKRAIKTFSIAGIHGINMVASINAITVKFWQLIGIVAVKMSKITVFIAVAVAIVSFVIVSKFS